MTFLQIYTECTDLRFNTQASKVAQVKKWVNQAEIALWNAADWVFKAVAPANLTITAGDNTPTMPADFGKVDGGLYDYNGVPLAFHDPREFDQLFLEDIVRDTRGEPTDYTVRNRQIELAPVPQVSRTFKLPYRRRYAHYSGAAAVTAGVMALTRTSRSGTPSTTTSSFPGRFGSARSSRPTQPRSRWRPSCAATRRSPCSRR